MRNRYNYRRRIGFGEYAEGFLSAIALGVLMATVTVGGLLYEDFFVAARVAVFGQ